MSEQVLEGATAPSNHENPDLVVIIGDFTTDNPSPIAKLAKRLGGLTSKTVPRTFGNYLTYLNVLKFSNIGNGIRDGIRLAETSFMSIAVWELTFLVECFVLQN